jgi:hypothetical protein
MKKIIFIIFSACIMFSCDPADQYPISYKIDGTTWYAASAPAFITVGNNFSVNGVSTVQNQKKTIFFFTQYNTPGTYLLDNVNNVFMYDDDGDTANGGYYAQNVNPGTLKITEFDGSAKRIAGEFYGKLYNMGRTDSILITDGKFRLTFQ